MRRLVLILVVVIIWLVGTMFLGREIDQLNSEIQDLQVALNHSETHLAMVTDSLIRADAALKECELEK